MTRTRNLAVCAAILIVAIRAYGSTLKIEAAAVERYEDGPPVFAPDTFAASERVYFSFLVQGFGRNANQVKERFEAQASDFNGVPIAPPVNGDLEATLTEEDKDWSPKLRGSIQLPELLFGGQYRLTVQLEDEISKDKVEKVMTFFVSGPRPEEGQRIAIRDLDFFAGPDSQKPLEIAAYRREEQVHARFRIQGFRHTTANAIDVSYGLSLIDSAGKTVYSADAPEHDTSEAFYPKPYLPCTFDLELTPKTPTGTYILKVTAYDGVAKEKAEAQASFRIE